MMFRKFLASVALATAVLVASFVGALPANASTYHVTFSGATLSGSFNINVTGTNVTSISGTINGSNITGLSGYAGSNNQWYSGGPTYVNFAGLSFTTATNAYNLGWTGSAYGIATQSINPNGACCGETPVTLAVSETPLPAALPLFVSGLGAMVLVVRRRKRKNAAAVEAV